MKTTAPLRSEQELLGAVTYDRPLILYQSPYCEWYTSASRVSLF